MMSPATTWSFYDYNARRRSLKRGRAEGGREGGRETKEKDQRYSSPGRSCCSGARERGRGRPSSSPRTSRAPRRHARCIRSVASLTPRTRHRIVSSPSFLVAANLWQPENPKYLPEPGGHSKTSMGSRSPCSEMEEARASTLSSSSAREPASGLLMAASGRSTILALGGVEARSALLASSDQPKAASAACAAVQVRGPSRPVSRSSSPPSAPPPPPPRSGLSWPSLGPPSLLGAVGRGLRGRYRLDTSGEGEGRGRRGVRDSLIVGLYRMPRTFRAETFGEKMSGISLAFFLSKTKARSLCLLNAL